MHRILCIWASNLRPFLSQDNTGNQGNHLPTIMSLLIISFFGLSWALSFFLMYNFEYQTSFKNWFLGLSLAWVRGIYQTLSGSPGLIRDLSFFLMYNFYHHTSFFNYFRTIESFLWLLSVISLRVTVFPDRHSQRNCLWKRMLYLQPKLGLSLGLRPQDNPR